MDVWKTTPCKSYLQLVHISPSCIASQSKRTAQKLMEASAPHDTLAFPALVLCLHLLLQGCKLFSWKVCADGDSLKILKNI